MQIDDRGGKTFRQIVLLKTLTNFVLFRLNEKIERSVDVEREKGFALLGLCLDPLDLFRLRRRTLQKR